MKNVTCEEYRKLIEYANTPNQIELLEFLSIEGNTINKAEVEFKRRQDSIQRSIKAINRRKTLVGDGEHFAGEKLPEGLMLKGTSTLRRTKDGIQWIKTERDKEQMLELMRQAVEDIVSNVDSKEIPSMKPVYTDENTMAVYNIGDAHIGMLAHRSEAGDDFDLNIAEHDLIQVMKNLVESAPPSKNAMIIDVGDYFHADNQSNETSGSHNSLDVDGRWYKVLKVGLNIMVELVREALTKHETVTVENAKGNHNEHSAMFLSLYLESWFRNEPRVIINTSPAMFNYHAFGKVLIGITHGHTCKPQFLGEVMASDCAKIWSDSEYRYWYTGHVHHDQVKEFRTYKFESFRTLASKDAWHAGAGYRSGRDMKCIILHKEYGEIQRHTVNLAMIGK